MKSIGSVFFEPFTVLEQDPLPTSCASESEHWHVGAFCHDLLQRGGVGGKLLAALLLGFDETWHDVSLLL